MQDEQSWDSETPKQDYGGAPSLEPVSWSASEFVSHQKTPVWYVGLGSVSAIITLVVFIISRDILAGLVVAMACMALGVFAARQPQTKSYKVGDDGISIDNRLFSYGMFKSFSVVDDEAVSCIWLRPLKKLMPTIVMYFAPEDEERIVLMLDNFLPQEDRQHDAVDRLSRRIRF